MFSFVKYIFSAQTQQMKELCSMFVRLLYILPLFWPLPDPDPGHGGVHWCQGETKDYLCSNERRPPLFA
jgi:hypothetical protein